MSEGRAIFAQVRQAVIQMEKDLDACQEELRAREAELSAREGRMAQVEAAFRENARQASERHRAKEAVIAMKAQQLTRLREEAQRDVIGLDALREEIQAEQSRLEAERLSLVTREACASEAEAKLRQTLLLVVTKGEKHSKQLAEAKERHKKQLAAQA